MGWVVGIVFQNVHIRVLVAFLEARGRRRLNLAKAAREGGQLGLGQILIAENDDRAVEQGGMDFIELPVGQFGRKVEPLDNGATGRRHFVYLDALIGHGVPPF
jgi:hypothetical protein